MAVTRTVRTTRRRTTRRSNQHLRKRKAPSNKTLNKKIKNIQNNLIELKSIDVYQGGAAFSSAGTLDFLLPIPQNDTASGRTGNVVSPTSIQFKLQVITNLLAVQATNIRVIIFWDQQANGTLPTLLGANGLLDNTTILDPTLAPHNYNQIKRFHVLFDRLFSINPDVVLTTVAGGTTEVVQKQMSMTVYRKLSRQVKFGTTGITFAAVNTNSLFVAFFTDAALNNATYNYGSRVYFRDA